MERRNSSWAWWAIGCLVLLPSAAFGVEPTVHAGFPVAVNGDIITWSSSAVGDVDGDGVDDIVVGGSDGMVYAYRGNGSRIWAFDTGGQGIGGKPVVTDVDGDGHAEVIVGSGRADQGAIADGGLFVISHLGALQCEYPTYDHDHNGFRDGVYASPAVGDIIPGHPGLEIAFTSWDWHVRVINPDCSLDWELEVHDTVWSSPALGDLDRDGDLDIVFGAPTRDAVPGYVDGGLLHALDGTTGAELPGFPIQIDETIQSSPALGDIDGDGWLDIVVGTGRCWSNPACAPHGDFHPGVGAYLNAWDHTGAYLPGWPVDLPDSTYADGTIPTDPPDGAYAFASPALADIDEDGRLDVVINTIDPHDVEGGQVYVLSGDGKPLPGWPLRPTVPKGPNGDVKHNSTPASPVVADLDGDGHLEIALPCSWEMVVWDRFGNQLTRPQWPPPTDGLWSLDTQWTIAGSAAVGDIDGDGDVELVVGGGSTGGASGAIHAWQMVGSAASLHTRAWPAFRGVSTNTALAVDPGGLFGNGFECGSCASWSAAVGER